LDFYLYNIAKESFYVNRPIEFESIPETRSVYKRLNVFRDVLGLKIDLPLSLAQLMIQWRNNLLHSAAENELDSSYSGKLKNASDDELKNFRHLDCSAMLENFKKGEPPKLKEVAGGIQAINLVAGSIDKIILEKVETSKYAERRLKLHIGPKRSTIQKIWGSRDSASKSSSLDLALSSAGIKKSAHASYLQFRQELENLSIDDALARLPPTVEESSTNKVDSPPI